ncbi:MAG: molybdenum cofactor biosynthesis protein MoaE [Taibaiella sp.]|nr:molybdenum cofactor biosynthesis protein MoaE [Taibaiella sp.]
MKILTTPLDASACTDWLRSAACGGIDVFIGTVRSHTQGRAVTRLEFEAYESMAVSEMAKIAMEAGKRWSIERILIHHRTGSLDVGEIPVIIGVAAPHRDAAFDACRFAIDTLKQTVPIWKKEVFSDGETWVAAHP